MRSGNKTKWLRKLLSVTVAGAVVLLSAGSVFADEANEDLTGSEDTQYANGGYYDSGSYEEQPQLAAEYDAPQDADASSNTEGVLQALPEGSDASWQDAPAAPEESAGLSENAGEDSFAADAAYAGQAPEQNADEAEQVPETDYWTIATWVYYQDPETKEFSYSFWNTDTPVEIEREEIGENLGAEVFLAGMQPGEYKVSIQLVYDPVGIWTEFIKEENVIFLNEEESASGKTLRIPFGEEVPEHYRKSGLYHISVSVTRMIDNAASQITRYDYAYEEKWDLRESYTVQVEEGPDEENVEYTKRPEREIPEQTGNTDNTDQNDAESGSAGENDPSGTGPLNGDPSNAGQANAGPAGNDTSSVPRPDSSTAGTDASGSGPSADPSQNPAVPGSAEGADPENTDPSAQTPSSQEQATQTVIIDIPPTVKYEERNLSGPQGSGAELITFSASEGPGGTFGSGGSLMSSASGPTLYSSSGSKTSSSSEKTSGSTASPLASLSGTGTKALSSGTLTVPGITSGKTSGVTLPGSGSITGSVPGLAAAGPASSVSGITTGALSGPAAGLGSGATSPTGKTASVTSPAAKTAEKSAAADAKEKETEQETTLAHGNPAKTGDESNFMVFVSTGVIALLAAGAIVWILRKRATH